ncbi:Flavin-linked sulfhydryl oxidase of the mitochondrial IMS [Saitoella coloradoensis]
MPDLGAFTSPVTDDRRKNDLPPGIVLGPDGKPCKSCTAFSAWAKLPKKKNATTTADPSSSPAAQDTVIPATLPPDCPPDVEALGRATWTFLHSVAATYPDSAPPEKQKEMSSFLRIFGNVYPCWVCADDFRSWMAKDENKPVLTGREALSRWMCRAHNEVNEKLGKPAFDCNKWEERWRTGRKGCFPEDV